MVKITVESSTIIGDDMTKEILKICEETIPSDI